MKEFKIIIIFLIFIGTIIPSILPHFHPEQSFNQNYFWQLDMLFHAGFYFINTLLILGTNSKTNKKYQLLILLFILSILLEFLQKWVPGRSFTPLDIISNTIGISGGIFLWNSILFIRKINNKIK